MRIAPAACAFIGIAFFGAGCSTFNPPACPEPQAQRRAAEVFFATDRQQYADGWTPRFGGMRSDPPRLQMGWERVALGPRHRLGSVDPAVAILSARGPVMTAGGARTDDLRRTDAEIAAFVQKTLTPAIRATLPPANGEPREVLLYVHGFNTTFDESVRKTAQLGGDLGFVTCDGRQRGVLITYSWPAEGALWSYFADEENAEWTQQRLAPFIQAVANACHREGARLHLIAHSMGTRALVRSLADLANTCGTDRKPERFADQVVLLAPDIGKGLFDQYVERLLPHIGHLTVYISARDRALSLSRLIHGGHWRVGLLESSVLAALELTGLHRSDYRELAYSADGSVESKVDMIDVSGLFASQFGHSYEGTGFLRDLGELLAHDTPAGVGARSNLERREIRAGFFQRLDGRYLRYFRLRPEQ